MFRSRISQIALYERKLSPDVAVSKDPASFRKFLDKLAKKLGFQTKEDWYKVRIKNIRGSSASFTFRSLLSTFEKSPANLLRFAYPDHTWIDWNFEKVPKDYWEKKENQRRFMDWLGIQLGFKKVEDWYKITWKDISEKGGESLLVRYDKSPSKTVMAIYPQHRLYWWKFENAPKGAWDSKENQREFLDWVSGQLGFKKAEDWYKITAKDISDMGGVSLLAKYGGSASKLAQSVYSNYKLERWRFEGLLKGYWDVLENQREFMDELSKQLEFADMNDWYRVTAKDILEKGGVILLARYECSPYKLLLAIFPYHDWDASKGAWESEKTEREIVDWIGIQLGLINKDGWYKVNATEIREKGGSVLIDKYGGLPSKLIMNTYPDHAWLSWRFARAGLERKQRVEIIQWLSKEMKIDELDEWYRVSLNQISEKISLSFFKQNPLEQFLAEAYPEHKWDIKKLQAKNLASMKASQRMLAKTLKEIFPESEMIENDRQENIGRGEFTRKMELDIYLPNERLAFEYQGEQHYYDIYAMGNLWIQKEKDKEKRRGCEDLGITLIEIPYWWDFKKSSLMATINEVKPNLVPRGDGEIIPKEPPNGFPKGPVPDLMHGEEWDGNENLQGWWLSEKMDGVRAFWNGFKLISRAANEISCPKWFIEKLPEDMKLDGELWMGRNKFEKTLSVVNSRENSHWKEIKFVIFDAIIPNEPYEIRMEQLKKIKLPSFVSIVNIRICLGTDDLMKQLNSIVSDGGEGIVATKSNSLYKAERTRDRLKVKLHNDSEVRVLEVVPTGFFCLQTNGIDCLVGFNYNDSLESTIDIGSVITVKHTGYYGNGRLRHAFYWRQRSDIQWKSISKENRTMFRDANWNNTKNFKLFFDSFAKHLGWKTLDNFYKTSVDQISKFGGKALLEYVFQGSIATALQSTYPHHTWIPWKFQQRLPSGFWSRVENRKQFFDWLGIELGFKQMDDWYQLTVKDLEDNGAGSLLDSQSNFSTFNLVQAVYPNHLWIKSKFPSRYWLDKLAQ